jgi:hypothetical protein
MTKVSRARPARIREATLYQADLGLPAAHEPTRQAALA